MKNSIKNSFKLSLLTLSIFFFLLIFSCSKKGITRSKVSNGTTTAGASAAIVLSVTPAATNINLILC